MLDVNSISQLLNDPQVNPNLRQHPLMAGQRGQGSSSGNALSIPGLGSSNGQAAFQELLAITQAQAEQTGRNDGGAVSREASRSLAQMRAMGMQNEMLSGMIDLEQTGQGSAAGLVERMNLEALLSSSQFGNLLGQKDVMAGLDTGRTFSPQQMSSWRQKNEGLGLRQADGPVQAETPVAEREGNLAMPYGLIRPPARPARNLAVEQQAAAQSVSGQAAPVKAEPAAAEPAKSEKELLAAQKNDADQADEFSMRDLDKLVNKVGLALGLDPNLVKAVIKTESNFNHKAVSRVGAKGLMQLMPGTAKDLGVEDPFNPVENVWGGARYLKKMLDRHGGNINKALASYNWGPGNFDRHGTGKMPKETRNYISIVNKHYASFKKNNSYQA